MNASNTVFDAKRLIGRRFSDPVVQADMKHWPFTVTQGPGGKPLIQVNFKGETKTFAPEEVSSMVLTKMREIAEAYLGKEVRLPSSLCWMGRMSALVCVCARVHLGSVDSPITHPPPPLLPPIHR